MKPYVKEVIDGMEAGWEACPRQAFDQLVKGNPDAPDACCAAGHYLLGTYGFAELGTNRLKLQEIKQDVWNVLVKVVELNNEKRMSTLEIIEWLKTNEV